jgi:hypothetical protein
MPEQYTYIGIVLSLLAFIYLAETERHEEK